MAKKGYRSYEDIHDREINSLHQALTESQQDALLSDQVAVEEAIQDAPVLEYDSGRSKTRVLFVTSDEAYINPTTDALGVFYDFARQFDEMHIIVLRAGIKPRTPSIRVRENIWLYIAHANYWWWTPVVASEVVAKNELVFASGFRPDVVVALEPYEAGLAARWIGKTYNRPVQVHVREDFYSRVFTRSNPHSWLRRRLAHYILRRSQQVAVATENIKHKLQARFSGIHTFHRLPRFHNFSAIQEATVTHSLRTTYPQYEFLMLYIGSLGYDSELHTVLDAVKYKLANPRVGLVIVGDGKAKGEFQRKAEKLGLATQVMFLPRDKKEISYLKTADVLLVSDVTGESNEVVLRGVAAGIPMILSETELRSDLFKDGESAFLYQSRDRADLTQRVNSFFHERERYSLQFKDRMKLLLQDKLHEDPVTYRTQFRDVVESVFLEEDEHESNTES
ncbi:MAG: glycosyltransferase [Patescibacteria group bacterium]